MDTLRLGLEWFINPDHVPFIIGQERGWFKEAGIELEMVEPEEHMDAFEEIKAGRMDLAVTEPIHLIADRDKGDPVVGFCRFLHTNGGVMYLRGKGIERPADMAGKRIQYPGAPGPGGIAIVKTMIEADGGQCDPEAFTPVNNGFYHTDALLEDKADLATLIFYNFEIIEARGRGADADFFSLRDWGVPDFCQLILFTSESILAEKRELLERFMAVISRGIDVIHQEPEAALKSYLARAGAEPDDAMTRAIYDATVPCFTFDFSMSAAYYRRLFDWMAQTGQIEGAMEDPMSCWSNDLAV